MSWYTHYERGGLGASIAALRADIIKTKAPPTASDQLLLAILLGLAGRWEEAIHSIHWAASKDPSSAAIYADVERCLVAEAERDARRADPCWVGKRTWLGVPPPFVASRAQACELQAEGLYRDACALLQQVEKATPAQAGTLVTRKGTRLDFVDMSDVDELTGPSFELIEDTLLDAPFAQTTRIVFEERRTFQDGLWCPVILEPREGPRRQGRMPVLYSGTFRRVAAGPVCVGRETSLDRRAGYVIASGRRDFRLRSAGGGEVVVSLENVSEITLEAVTLAPSEEASGERTTWRPPPPDAIAAV
jgi:protein involved in temperature-dependent protein secretion